jgi:hypothetical protein
MAGPLYEYDHATKKLKNENPIDTLFLTRFKGNVRADALGPKLSSIDEISKSFERASTYTEYTQDGSWSFEQWNKRVKQ